MGARAWPALTREGRSLRLEVEVPAGLARYIAAKGR